MGAVAMEVLSALWFIGIYKVPLLTRPLCSTLMLFGRHLGILNAFVLCLCLVNGVEWGPCVCFFKPSPRLDPASHHLLHRQVLEYLVNSPCPGSASLPRCGAEPQLGHLSAWVRWGGLVKGCYRIYFYAGPHIFSLHWLSEIM